MKRKIFWSFIFSLFVTPFLFGGVSKLEKSDSTNGVTTRNLFSNGDFEEVDLTYGNGYIKLTYNLYVDAIYTVTSRTLIDNGGSTVTTPAPLSKGENQELIINQEMGVYIDNYGNVEYDISISDLAYENIYNTTVLPVLKSDPILKINSIDVNLENDNSYFSFVVNYTYVPGDPANDEKAFLNVTDMSFTDPKTEQISLLPGDNVELVIDQKLFPDFNFFPGNEFFVGANTINAMGQNITLLPQSVILQGIPSTLKINGLASSADSIVLDYTYSPEEPLYYEKGYVIVENKTTNEKSEGMDLEAGFNKIIKFNSINVEGVSFNPEDEFKITIYTENSSNEVLPPVSSEIKLAKGGLEPLDPAPPVVVPPIEGSKDMSLNNVVFWSITTTGAVIGLGAIGLIGKSFW